MSKSTRWSPDALKRLGMEESEEGKFEKKGNFVWGEEGKVEFKEDPDGRFTVANHPKDFTGYVGGVDPVSPDSPVFVSKSGKPYERELESWDHGQKAVESVTKLEKVYVGVDPGINGAIAFTAPDGHFFRKVVPRLANGDPDIRSLFDHISAICRLYEPVFIMEDVHAIFGVAAKTTFQFGFIVGVLRAVIESTNKRLELVQPKTWQKVIWSTPDKVYKPLKEGQKNPSVDTKATSMVAAKRLFPAFDFSDPDKQRSNKQHDGIIDAILLAEYGRRLNL